MARMPDQESSRSWRRLSIELHDFSKSWRRQSRCNSRLKIWPVLQWIQRFFGFSWIWEYMRCGWIQDWLHRKWVTEEPLWGLSLSWQPPCLDGLHWIPESWRPRVSETYLWLWGSWQRQCIQGWSSSCFMAVAVNEILAQKTERLLLFLRRIFMTKGLFKPSIIPEYKGLLIMLPMEEEYGRDADNNGQVDE